MTPRSNPLATALTLGLLTAISSTQLLAAEIQPHADAIQVSDPYTREMPPGAFATASFMTLSNTSDQNIKLVQADTNAAKSAELHTHTNDNGVMRMRQVSSFDIPAKGQTKLQPGGNHIMLISPSQTIKTGNTVSVTLTFEDGSSKKVTMPVKSVMNMGKNEDHSHHHH